MVSMPTVAWEGINSVSVMPLPVKVPPAGFPVKMLVPLLVQTVSGLPVKETIGNEFIVIT